jgi:hypothetical protein
VSPRRVDSSFLVFSLSSHLNKKVLICKSSLQTTQCLRGVPKHDYLNPIPNPRIRSRCGFVTGGDGDILQGHRYLESRILGVQSRLRVLTVLMCGTGCCSEIPTAQHRMYNKMGLFENLCRPSTDPADHDLEISLPPPTPQEKHPQPTQKCLPIKTSSSPMR